MHQEMAEMLNYTIQHRLEDLAGNIGVHIDELKAEWGAFEKNGDDDVPSFKRFEGAMVDKSRGAA